MIQLVVKTLVDAYSAPGHICDNRRDIGAVNDPPAVEVVALHSRKRLTERSGMILPMEKIPAGYMLLAREVPFVRTVPYFLEISDVISPVPVDHAVKIIPAALRGNEMIAWPLPVGNHLFPEFIDSHEQIVVLARRQLWQFDYSMSNKRFSWTFEITASAAFSTNSPSRTFQSKLFT